MSGFKLFFVEGVNHIADLQGIDHILFIAALSLGYAANEWKKLLMLVTAFTIGHCLTLALSTLDFIYFSREWTEFLIAVTILATSVNNLRRREQKNHSAYMYPIALV